MIETVIAFTLLIALVTSGDKALIYYNSAIEGSGFGCVYTIKPTLKGNEYHTDSIDGRIILYDYELDIIGEC